VWTAGAAGARSAAAATEQFRVQKPGEELAARAGARGLPGAASPRHRARRHQPAQRRAPHRISPIEDNLNLGLNDKIRAQREAKRQRYSRASHIE